MKPLDSDSQTPRIMVDELRAWPGVAAPYARRAFGEGKLSCHLTIEGGDNRDPASLEALHVFAEKIGLHREWFHRNSSAPHYDLTPLGRQLALEAGAVEVSARDQARARRASRACF